MKYKKTDITIQAWEHFKQTQEKMNETYKKLTGKEKKIPLTRVIELKAKQPTYLFDSKLFTLFKKGKIKI